MPAKKYRIELTPQEREELKGLVSRGRTAAYKQTHARILLMSDEAQDDLPMTDEAVAKALKVGHATVERVRRRWVEEGLEAALNRKNQLRRRPRKLDGEAQAHLIAIACSEPPQGRATRSGALDAEAVGGPMGRARHGRVGQHRDGAQGAKKTNSSRG